jgi:hypothetical protein
MLCFEQTYDNFGQICTNRCPKRQDCNKIKPPTLIQSGLTINALDVLSSEINLENTSDFYAFSFSAYTLAPEAYLNEVINDDVEN